MVYRGRVENGVVVLDNGSSLPEGTEVTVQAVAEPRSRESRQHAGLRDSMMKFAGRAKGLPRDASVNIDHYLYGHPKR
jgi:hypothetical protein